MKAAPNPNAAKLFQSYCYTAECQQLLIDVGGLRSVHPNTKEKPGRTPFASIKKWKDDPAGVDKSADMIKKRYSQISACENGQSASGEERSTVSNMGAAFETASRSSGRGRNRQGGTP